MPLQIMKNLYPESWLYLTGHCYVRSMFVKHHFVAEFFCLFVVPVFYYYHYYYYYYYYLLLLLLFICFIIIIIIIIIINWYKLDCKFLQSYVNFFPISNKVLIILLLLLLLDDFLDTLVILSAFLLMIKSPVASAVF